MWGCYYSVEKRDKTIQSYLKAACYSTWYKQLHMLNSMEIYIPVTDKDKLNLKTNFSDKEIKRYFRAMQKMGLRFTWGIKPKVELMFKKSYYDNIETKEVFQHLYVIKIDLVNQTHMNAQVIMNMIRHLYENPGIVPNFFRFLDDKSIKLSAWNKYLIAHRYSPNAGHGFITFDKLCKLMSVEDIKTYITENKTLNPTTYISLPLCKTGNYSSIGQMIADITKTLKEIHKAYVDLCEKYM